VTKKRFREGNGDERRIQLVHSKLETAATTTVKITKKQHETLRQIAVDSGETMQTVLGRALESYRRQRILQIGNDAYLAMRNDPEQWREELAERVEWDATLADGLEEDR